MKIGIIIGSHREASQSAKVAEAVSECLESIDGCDELFCLDLGGNPLPLWDESVWADDPDWQNLLDPILAELESCDGFVVISPEWSGMAPPGLKNFFLFCKEGELSNKPGYLISVSAGDGGAYPIAELRSSSYKNTRICYLPEHLIVRHVESVFNDDEADNDARSHEYLSARLSYGLEMLCSYATALAAVRNSGVCDNPRFHYGM